jgi:integrase
MTLNNDIWPSFSTYLFVDRKLDKTGNNFSTKRSRFRYIVRYFQDKDFNRDNFNKLIQEQVDAGKSHNYINNLITITKQLADHLHVEEFKTYSYFKKENRRYETLTPAEIKLMAEWKRLYGKMDTEINNKYRTIIYFLGLTGCRISELLNLKWEDVGENPYSVIFRDTKNGTDRIIPISPDLHGQLVRLPRYSDFVFSSYYGARLDKTTVRYEIQERAKLAGVKKKVWLHLFRHSYITTMLESGVDISDVARLVGHQNLQSTMNYKNSLIGHYNNLIFLHPLLKEQLTIDMIDKRTKDFLAKLIDNKRFNIAYKNEANKILIEIQENITLGD